MEPSPSGAANATRVVTANPWPESSPRNTRTREFYPEAAAAGGEPKGAGAAGVRGTRPLQLNTDTASRWSPVPAGQRTHTAWSPGPLPPPPLRDSQRERGTTGTED